MSELTYSFSVCICTRDRPEDLRVALASVAASHHAVAQIVVSDDSSDPETEALIRAERMPITYVKGPQRGLGANRNFALRHIRGTHVLLLDDDAAVRPDYFDRIAAAYQQLEPSARARTIVSGVESSDGRHIYPSDIGFLGYMDQPRVPESGTPLHTFVINATVFPVQVFEEVGFDENLVYGYDEADLSTRCAAKGYVIRLVPSAVVEHYSSPLHRSSYAAFAQGSRLYTTFKRYFYVYQQPWKAMAYVPCAVMHLAVHGLLRRQCAGVVFAIRSALVAARYMLRYRRCQTDRAPLL